MTIRELIALLASQENHETPVVIDVDTSGEWCDLQEVRSVTLTTDNEGKKEVAWLRRW